MWNANRGYVGYSRSRRSQDAIENYEVPLSHITRDLIHAFTEEFPEYEPLNDVPVVVWKHVADHLGPDSWHHTSNRFNRTDHYSLMSIAERLTADGTDSWLRDYKTSKTSTDEPALELVVVTAELWGGTRTRPRMYGHETVLCVLKGNTAYPVTDAEKSHYLITASKNTLSKRYKLDEYPQLTKDYKQFKSTKRAVNKVVKRLTAQ